MSCVLFSNDSGPCDNERFNDVDVYRELLREANSIKVPTIDALFAFFQKMLTVMDVDADAL